MPMPTGRAIHAMTTTAAAANVRSARCSAGVSAFVLGGSGVVVGGSRGGGIVDIAAATIIGFVWLQFSVFSSQSSVCSAGLTTED
jgi:hypothetical protein